MKYAWITDHRDSFPVAVMCDLLKVSSSGYYDSIDRPPSARAERHERIKQAVQQVHAKSYGIHEPEGVGWSIGSSLATELVSDALRAAIESRRPDGKQLLHHSDRGCQYTSDAYQKTLRTLGIECSMSRTGCCYDNAAIERFFWSLKHEWTNHETFAN